MKLLSSYLFIQRLFQDSLTEAKLRWYGSADVSASKSNPSPLTSHGNVRIMIRAWSWCPPIQENTYATQ